MDLLDEIAGTQPVNIDNFVEERPLKPLPVSESTLKNMASKAAILSGDPTGIANTYQAIVAEGKEGRNDTYQKIVSDSTTAHKDVVKKGIVSLLADPNVPIELKDAAIKNIDNYKLYDDVSIIASRAAEAPVKGESIEHEEVRLGNYDAFANIRAYNEEKQKILNRNSVDWSSKTVVDFVEMLIPFSFNKQGVSTLEPIAKALKLNQGKAGAAALPGSTMKNIVDAYQRMPAGERLQLINKIEDIVAENSGLVMDNNSVVSAMELRAILEGDYSKFDMALDNAVGVLDAIGLGGIVRGPVKVATKLFSRSKTETEAAIKAKSVADATAPVSPVNIVKDINADQVRGMYALAVSDSTGEVSRAVSGASKEDLVAASNLPQVSTSGAVESKVNNVEKFIQPDNELIEAVRDTGGFHWTDNEANNIFGNLVDKLTNASGIYSNPAETIITRDGDRFVAKALYGTPEGGFSDADTALQAVNLSLRDFGITNTQLMKKVDGEYVPVSLAEAKGVKGDYKVSVNLEKQFEFMDLTKADDLTVKRNFFDRFTPFRWTGGKQGTAANMLADHASMLDKHITGGAVRASDRAVRLDKILLKPFSEFSDGFTKLPSDRQALLMEYVKDANLKGYEDGFVTLIGKGFTKHEAELLGKWRKAWDNNYYLENMALGRSLANNGFKVFDDGQTKLFVKEISKNKNIETAYDTATDSVVKLSAKEVDDLYDAGGTLARLRRPSSMQGEVVEHVILRNTGKSYSRAIQPTDQILSYKKGYYSTYYDAPLFIVQKVRSAGGVGKTIEYEKAIGAAKDSKEAEIIRQRAIQQGFSPEDIFVREDRNSLSVNSDYFWDVQSSHGRLAQRHRGERLEGATVAHVGISDQLTLNPMEAAIRASRSVSRHIAHRDYIDAVKQRAVSKYEQYFPKEEGRVKWPSNSNELKPITSATGSEIADARTLVEYVNFLENGYVNGLDTGWKAGMNYVAEALSKVSPSFEGLAYQAGRQAPGSFLKSGVFTAYIALNPIRQAIIQSHQAIRLVGYSPTAFYKAGLQSGRYFAGKINPKLMNAEDLEIAKYVEESGMLDAIDRHNLVRGSITDMAESRNMLAKGVGKPIEISRKIGFDTGESVNLLNTLLTVRNKFISEGKNLKDKRVKEEAYSTARALSYDMNSAGDMPYNQNTLGLFLQFFQVPHKAFLQATNRRLSREDRLKLFAIDSALWGIPGYAVIENLLPDDALPKDSKARQFALEGAEMTGLNGFLSKLAGESININFVGSLGPYGTEGFEKLAEAIIGGGIGEIITNSPAYSFYLKEGGRVREAMSRMYNYLGNFVAYPKEGHDPETIKSVAQGLAEISSGWSNAYKGYLMHEMGKLQDKNGRMIMEDPHYFYAIAQIFGFKSVEEGLQYSVRRELSDLKKSRQEELDEVYKSYVRVLTRDQQLAINDPEAISRVLGFIKYTYRNDPKAMEYLHGRLEQEMPSNKQKIVKAMIEAANFPDSYKELQDIYNLGAIGDEDYNKALQLGKDMQERIKELESFE